jgi:hypothetical protein
LLCGDPTTPAQPPQSPPVKATTDDKGKPEETKTVPKKLIHVSNPDQDNPRPKDWTRADAEMVQEILSVAKQGGPSNVLLVHGDDLRWAVASTWQAYNPYSSAGAEAVLTARNPSPKKKMEGDPPKEKPFDVWVVAYLGRDSSSRWSIKSVERTGNRIRVLYTDHYRDPGVLVRVGDDKPYMMWAPLGRLEPGKYTVELYETNDKEVNLTRLVKVK